MVDAMSRARLPFQVFMRRWILAMLMFPATAIFAQSSHPTTTEIRRGLEMPATTEPAERQQAILEQIARRIEPDLKGDPARLQTYVDFYKRESVRDPRLFPVDVAANVDADGAIVLSGFVEYPQHQASIELLLKTLGFQHIRNEIVVASDRLYPTAPADGSEDALVGFGIVSAPRAAVYNRVDAPRENLTEGLFGEPVFVVRHTNNEYDWIHTSDGYVGYVKTTDIVRMNRSRFTQYLRASHATLRRACDSPCGELPAGARVTVAVMHADKVECELSNGSRFTIAKSAIVERNEIEPMQKIEGVVMTAQKLIGTKYVWGGRTKDGIDCSGLTQLAYSSVGINLPRDADQQAYVGRFVAPSWYRDGMARGDLMFFISRRGTIGHVALYLGDNQFLEAADEGVKISSLNPKDPNYDSRRDKSFAFARRVIE
jgi:hypothetical protein